MHKKTSDTAVEDIAWS